MQSHHLVVAALSEQHRADLHHQAEQARVARRLARRTRRRTGRRWWLLAQRPADA